MCEDTYCVVVLQFVALYRTHYLYDAFNLYVPSHLRHTFSGGGLVPGQASVDPEVAAINMLRLGWRPSTGLEEDQPNWPEFNTAWGMYGFLNTTAGWVVDT